MAQMSTQIMVRLTTDFYEEVEAIAKAEGSGVATTFRNLARIGLLTWNRFQAERVKPTPNTTINGSSLEDTLKKFADDMVEHGKRTELVSLYTDAISAEIQDEKILIAETKAEIAEIKAQTAEIKAHTAELKLELAKMKEKEATAIESE